MRKPLVFLLKNIGLIASSRAYYVASHIIMLYLLSFFLFNLTINKLTKFLDFKIHFIILSSSLTIASGFLINNFYDKENDVLAKPFRIQFNNLISENSKLNFYLIFNLLALILSLICSIKIFITIIFYQFLIWFYSHKIKKILVLNNLLLTFLIFYPYLIILYYLKENSTFIILNIFLLFSLLFLSDVLKDFKSAKLDLIHNYSTIPNYFKNPKIIVYIIVGFILFYFIFLLINSNFIAFFNYYYVFGILLLIFFIYLIHQSKNLNKLGVLGLIVKLYVILGVLYLPLHNSIKLLLNINLF